MINLLNRIILVGFTVLVYSCDFFDPGHKYKQINADSELNLTIDKIVTRNGFILNNEYYYGGGVFLQKNNNTPKWLLKEFALDDGTVLFSDDGEVLLDIWKIKTPFQIYKKTNSNILNLVKNKDTLQFRIYF